MNPDRTYFSQVLAARRPGQCRWPGLFALLAVITLTGNAWHVAQHELIEQGPDSAQHSDCTLNHIPACGADAPLQIIAPLPSTHYDPPIVTAPAHRSHTGRPPVRAPPRNLFI